MSVYVAQRLQESLPPAMWAALHAAWDQTAVVIPVLLLILRPGLLCIFSLRDIFNSIVLTMRPLAERNSRL